eukprot:ctg_1005.g392
MFRVTGDCCRAPRWYSSVGLERAAVTRVSAYGHRKVESSSLSTTAPGFLPQDATGGSPAQASLPPHRTFYPELQSMGREFHSRHERADLIASTWGYQEMARASSVPPTKMPKHYYG